MLTQKSSMSALIMLSLLGFAACKSNGGPSHVPTSYFEGNVLDRNAITPKVQTRYLEVHLDPRDTQLRRDEVVKLKAFLADYTDHGHGKLQMIMPEDTDRQPLAVGAVVETRQFAWEAGIEYAQIEGAAYTASGKVVAPVVLTFTSYEAIPPQCTPYGEMDYANAVSNSDLPTLGCAVRTNMAAMVADPADLKGLRVLDEADAARMEIQLSKWRQGDSTGSERGGDESVSISTAVN